MKRCDDQRQASSEELNRKTEDTHSKVWEDMMKTSKECDESRWDRAIKLLSESLGRLRLVVQSMAPLYDTILIV